VGANANWPCLGGSSALDPVVGTTTKIVGRFGYDNSPVIYGDKIQVIEVDGVNRN